MRIIHAGIVSGQLRWAGTKAYDLRRVEIHSSEEEAAVPRSRESQGLDA